MKSLIMTMLLVSALSSSALFGADKKKSHDMKSMNVTAEQRQAMATAHEKMAACLRSDRAFDECHKEMVQSCSDTMGKDMCPMMGHGKGKGKMHDMKDMKHDEMKPEDKK